ncbi:CAF17-like 4Fe-4S cluster assembly/insertion protein YgfZ [Sphingomonas sp. M1-B02]|uniref:CAF17-like 4Fe-4S cluster assembly/insertion protein YgfZ n=1 Tax=Sphingomonas sp. M1-B02 TaxID=3114300 RepID=UPI00223FCD54|nr:folate-binding protein [Sphingomonas sp. S6-11]UZK64937.1 folate-binding protein [Sphingomonas sp. S6-11]
MPETTPSEAATRLPDRALLRISGEDVRGFLQGLVTQDLASVTPETPQYAGLLTPQGKALFDFILWADGEAILIDCETGQRDALARRLSIYRLRRPVAIEPIDGGVHWSTGGTRGVPDPRLAALGRRWLGPAEGAPATGWLKHRLSLGVTEGAAELGQDKTLWLESNAAELNGVSFTKGCYVGQENTARMHYRAKVNRRLMVAPLGEPGERTRAVYPELDLMVELRRVEALADALVPDWLGRALATGGVDPAA